MFKHFILTLGLLGLLGLTSCNDMLTPDGPVVDRETDLPTDLTRIEIADGIRLILSDEIPEGKALIRTHSNIQPYIKSEINGDRILFEVDARRFRDLDVTISAAPGSFCDFTASGGSKLHIQPARELHAGYFTASGGSQMIFTGRCEQAMFDCSGGSQIHIAGTGNLATIDCSGGSSFHGYDFEIQRVAVNVSGGSHLEVHAIQSLTGENSGGSTIRYAGQPQTLNINNSGGSTTSAR